MTQADNPGIKVPPPAIFASGLALGWLLDAYVTGWRMGLPTTLRLLCILGFGLAGLVLVAAALRLFVRADTRAEPWKPTTALVFDGVYAYTRNPMYLGMASLYAAIAFWSDRPLALALLIPVIIIIDRAVIAREERYLEAKFGTPYLNYKAYVRRWL